MTGIDEVDGCSLATLEVGVTNQDGEETMPGRAKVVLFDGVPADIVTSVATLIDTYEKHGRLGTMLFLVDESRWTNQRGELVKLGLRTSIYY